MLISDAAPELDSIERIYGFDIAGDALQDYPIWEEAKRDWLNERIIDHFRFRQIAQETPQQFLFFLRRQMHEVMPGINPIFQALDGADVLAAYESNTTMASDQESRQVFSVTPQTQLSGAENYATNMTDANATLGNSSHTTGRNQSVVGLATEWAAGMNNALDMVFLALEPLFNQVWD